MGALHDGHFALINAAVKKARRTVVSIYVNPTQFAPDEDLDRYPTNESDDLRKLAGFEVDLVWAPSTGIMYQDGFATKVIPQGAAAGLESDARPHFFAGVATVVLKLFNQVTPDFATFGEKDYQQLCVVRQLIKDFDLPIKVLAVPTVREKDNLALSSRNSYLSPEEREIAPALHKTLLWVAQEARTDRNPVAIRSEATMKLLTAGFSKVDYVEIRDAQTLGDFDPRAAHPGRVLAAAWLGTTRLIDNVAIKTARKGS